MKVLLLLVLFHSISMADNRAADIKSFFGADFKQVIYDNGQGRLDLKNGSYYIFSPNAKITYIIPLATSRSDQKAHPPIVYIFKNDLIKPIEEPLAEFLLKEIFRKHAREGMLDLYRGAERDDERQDWERGFAARGARYWTPSIDYAWRYARRQKTFLADTANNQSPILHFRISLQDLERQVRSGKLILGAELPAHVHKLLESGRGFIDHLTGNRLYLGFPEWGMEIEIHSGRERSLFVNGYKRPVTWTEMVKSRENQIQLGYERAVHQWPDRQKALESERDARLKQIAEEVANTDFENWSDWKCKLLMIGEVKP